jgi:beta-glucosidase
VKAYRFSIEWSRIFPTRAAFNAGTPDATGVAAYHSLLSALHAAGIRPFVTLHHFATPDYLDDITQPSQPQTFERPEMQASFVKWATFAGKEYGGEVDDWLTINEPLVLLIGGYVAGGHPPGAPADLDRMVAAAKKMIRTHASVYEALHAADTIDSGTGAAARVSIAKHNRAFYPDDPCEPGDVLAAQKTDYIWNEWIYNALVFGNWDDDLDGTLTGMNDITGDPTLKNHVDFIGVNYYGDATLSSKLALPYVGGVPNYTDLGDGLPTTDLGWDIFPQGFRKVLSQLKQYGLPIIVTENGIADSSASGGNKQRYLAEHVWEMGRAIADDGLDIQGYFFWALTDNFEWGNGFCPKFGLYSVDLTSAARTRTADPAAALFDTISTGMKITTSMIDALPAYAAPHPCPGP